MKKSIISLLTMVGVCLSACTQGNRGNNLKASIDVDANQKTSHMKNLISIVEIPTVDFSRATSFYKQILNIDIEVVTMDGIKLGLFPGSSEGTSVQLIYGDNYKPAADGTIIYLNGGEDLQKVADKVEVNGGKIILPKTEIGPEMGFYAMFIDTEGNRLGLYSLH